MLIFVRGPTKSHICARKLFPELSAQITDTDIPVFCFLFFVFGIRIDINKLNLLLKYQIGSAFTEQSV